MALRIESNGETVTAFLEGEIDHNTAAEMREAIDAHLAGSTVKLLILDFRDVTFMDSSGIGLVMGRFRNLQRTGAAMHITGTSPQITKVMKLAGIGRLAKMDVGGFKVETDK